MDYYEHGNLLDYSKTHRIGKAPPFGGDGLSLIRMARR